MPVKIHIVYCGGWGYKPKANRLQTQIEDEIGDEGLQFSKEPTRNVSGYFEVTVNGQMIHSKKNGDGYIDNKEKLDKIVKAIEAAKWWESLIIFKLKINDPDWSRLADLYMTELA